LLVRLDERPRHEFLVLADHEHLREAEGQQPDGRSLGVPLRDARRRTTEQVRDHCIATLMLVSRDIRRQVERPGEIDHPSNGQRTADVQRAARRLVGTGRRPHGEVSPSRVPDKDHAPKVEVVLARQSADIVDRPAHVEVRTGSAATGLAKPAVLDIPGRDPLCLEGITHRCQVARGRIGRLEAASMDEDRHRVWALALRQPEFPILAGTSPA
jgi:hypothetical protein